MIEISLVEEQSETPRRRVLSILACLMIATVLVLAAVPNLLNLRALADDVLYTLVSVLRWLPLLLFGLLGILMYLTTEPLQQGKGVAAVSLLFLGQPGQLYNMSSYLFTPLALLILASYLAHEAPAWHPKGLRGPFAWARLVTIFLFLTLVVGWGVQTLGLHYEQFSYQKLEILYCYSALFIYFAFGLGLLSHISHLLRNSPRVISLVSSQATIS